MGPEPQVAVGLPVYNGEEFVATAIKSVLAQTFHDLELVVSDNASTDRTGEICQDFAARDPRVKYYRAPQNQGIAWNYNQVFKLSAHEYFMWFSHDDVLAPEYIERSLEVLKSDPSVVLCYSNWGEIDENGQLLSSNKSKVTMDSSDPVRRFREAIRLEHLCEPWCGVTRSETVKKIGMYGNFADYDRVVFAELGLYGRFIEIQETLFFRREHKGRSIHLHPSRFERASWINPRRAGAIVFPHCRELIEFWAAVGRSELAGREKLLCKWALVKWGIAYWHRIRVDVKTAGTEILRRGVNPILRMLKKRKRR